MPDFSHTRCILSLSLFRTAEAGSSERPGDVCGFAGHPSSTLGHAPTPDALSRNLACPQVDLTGEDFRAHLLKNAKQTRKEIESLLRAALLAGELRRDVAPQRLARATDTAIGGSLMPWACYREGPAAAWIRRDLDAVLKPCLARRGTAAKAKLKGAS